MKLLGKDITVNVPSLPSSGVNGQIVYLTTDNKFYGWNGAWSPLGSSASTTTVYDAPVGATMAWSGLTIPSKYVLANGQRLSQSTWTQGYDFAKQESDAGNPMWTYRTSDSTFTVPNLSDRFIYSSSTSSIGTTGGEATHQLTIPEMPVHSHTNGRTIVTGPGGPWTMTSGAKYSETISTDAGGDQPHNNMPPYIVLALVVKLSFDTTLFGSGGGGTATKSFSFMMAD